MAGTALALTYALFVWWFSTGLVLLLVLRARRTVRWSLVGAALLFPLSLVALAETSVDTSVFGAYVAFTAAIVLWGTQELAFLTGLCTGPRPLPCPPGVTGWRRAAYATSAILYHELALAGSGIALLAVTHGAPNQAGLATFMVLWVMRLSAKLNLFLGVPVLNDEVMPDHLVFLRSYFRRGPVNGLFPVAMVLAILALAWFGEIAFADAGSEGVKTGALLAGALLALAILEHGFMLVRLPIDALWQWSTRGRARPAVVQVGPTGPEARDLGDLKQGLRTHP